MLNQDHQNTYKRYLVNLCKEELVTKLKTVLFSIDLDVKIISFSSSIKILGSYTVFMQNLSKLSLLATKGFYGFS